MASTPEASLMSDAINSAINAAPALTVAVAAVFLVARLFLKTWQQAEESRMRAMDERHSTYFSMLGEMQEQHNLNTQALVQSMDRGTKALQESTAVNASVRELLRNPRLSLKGVNENQ